ncbi:hypothetical protein GA0061098_100735 [Bradyrhizobium shewense]|uniref:Uncharacterized protein n=1 Tax=Bradyrhizobium shewense TaxID=1761772 RepID=A0A1C3WAM9_9BRAD|nr:hypothetical protein GA0061098_100735 [Bradyrhizobium shewense]
MLSIDLHKNIPLYRNSVSAYVLRIPAHQEGRLCVVTVASRACGGRGSVGTRGAGRAGSPCEPEASCDERRCQVRLVCKFPLRRQGWKNCGEMAGRAYGKTVWSWPSLLRSSCLRRCARAQPGGLHRQFERRGRPEGTRLPGEHGISRPTIAQGRPSDRRHLYAAVRFFLRVLFAQRTAGASRHPVFPAPSWIRGWSDEAKLGRIKPRGREGVSVS